MKGLGIMEVNGGSVISNRYGVGSGGRIVIEIEMDLFLNNGKFLVVGGNLFVINGRGGLGFIYIKLGKGKSILEILIIDNFNG